MFSIKWRITTATLIIIFIEIIYMHDVTMVEENNNAIPSMMDIVLYMLKGIKEYIPGEEKFIIPYAWMSTQFLCAFVIFNSINNDLESYGLNMLVFSKNRTMWWLSKCSFSIVVTMIVYAVVYVSAFFISGIYGGGFNFTQQYFEQITGISYNGIKEIPIMVFLFTMPVVTSITLNIFQMVTELAAGALFSIMLNMAVCIMSVYFMTPLLIGNFSMVLRNTLIVGNEGIDSVWGICAELILVIALVLLGNCIFKRKDIL